METDQTVIPVDDLLSIKQASIRFGIPRRTLYYWIAEGKVRRFVVGETIYAHCDDIASIVGASYRPKRLGA